MLCHDSKETFDTYGTLPMLGEYDASPQLVIAHRIEGRSVCPNICGGYQHQALRQYLQQYQQTTHHDRHLASTCAESLSSMHSTLAQYARALQSEFQA